MNPTARIRRPMRRELKDKIVLLTGASRGIGRRVADRLVTKGARVALVARSADLFSMLIEGAHSCVQCIGMRKIGEHLVQVVDLMVENSRQQQLRARTPTDL